MSLVTTLPAPMTVGVASRYENREPIFTPGQIMTPPPTHTSSPNTVRLS
jgi:hypothetical protein